MLVKVQAGTDAGICFCEALLCEIARGEGYGCYGATHAPNRKGKPDGSRKQIAREVVDAQVSNNYYKYGHLLLRISCSVKWLSLKNIVIA